MERWWKKEHLFSIGIMSFFVVVAYFYSKALQETGMIVNKRRVVISY